MGEIRICWAWVRSVIAGLGRDQDLVFLRFRLDSLGFVGGTVGFHGFCAQVVCIHGFAAKVRPGVAIQGDAATKSGTNSFSCYGWGSSDCPSIRLRLRLSLWIRFGLRLRFMLRLGLGLELGLVAFTQETNETFMVISK